jgi:hypothetical protein
MALFVHGYRRFTEDVDIPVTRESLERIQDALEGPVDLPPFEGSKHLRDTNNGVRIEFIVAGDYPGDGKPKHLAFPDPVQVVETFEGVRAVRLPVLIALKLASGMTNPGRLKDLADVQEVIKLIGRPESYADLLDPYIRAKFLELFQSTTLGQRLNPQRVAGYFATSTSFSGVPSFGSTAVFNSSL